MTDKELPDKSGQDRMESETETANCKHDWFIPALGHMEECAECGERR